METKNNVLSIAKTLDKLFNAGFNTDKKIIAMKMEDLEKLSNLTSSEIFIIIGFKQAIKDRKIIEYLSGYQEKGTDK
ncbi:MAG: hypothetical protein U0M92_03600 [Bacilli bacterium]